MNNIWIAPASDDAATVNIPKSLSNEIPDGIKEKLQLLGISEHFAWGARRGGRDVNVGKFERMKPGDVCLFYTETLSEGQKKKAFNWVARITSTLHSLELASELWPFEKGEAFELIYFLSTPIGISLTIAQVSQLLSETGEKYAGAPTGLMSIASENLKIVEQRLGSTPLLRTLLKRGTMCQRSVHVQTQKIQP